MKKYRCYYLNDFRDDYDAMCKEDADGDWYRVEDADKRIAELEASMDVLLPCWRDGWDRDIEMSALAMERRRVEECEVMLHRCEMWLSTHPEGMKMREAVRDILDPNPKDPTNQYLRICRKGHIPYSASFRECPSCKVERERR